VIAYRHRQNFFSLFLADDVIIQLLANFSGRQQRALLKPGLFNVFLEDIVAELDAFVTIVDSRSCNQSADFGKALALYKLLFIANYAKKHENSRRPSAGGSRRHSL
jgi:hypothetical protein